MKLSDPFPVFTFDPYQGPRHPERVCLLKVAPNQYLLSYPNEMDPRRAVNLAVIRLTDEAISICERY